VKLVHPDILGEESVALQALVTEAYNTLSDEKRRASYDRSLGKKHCRNATLNSLHDISVWAPTAPPDVDAIFVDEGNCVRCNNCIDIAPSTFAYRETCGDERARVVVQYGDDATEIEWAVKSCPTGAISYVPREDVPFLEIAMANINGQSYENWRARRGGPFHLYHQVKARYLEKEARLGPHAAPDALVRQANAIKAAIDLIPQPIVLRAWPHAATDDDNVTFQEEERQLEEV
jgi:ferredoxin